RVLFRSRRWPQEVKKSLEAVAARVKIGDVDKKQKITAEVTASTFKIGLKEGPTQLQTWLTLPNGKQRGAYFVEVKRIAGP
ncbi:MAG: N-acetylgalactosamine-6-sulfatase, partial [Pirellulales bacterium]